MGFFRKLFTSKRKAQLIKREESLNVGEEEVTAHATRLTVWADQLRTQADQLTKREEKFTQQMAFERKSLDREINREATLGKWSQQLLKREAACIDREAECMKREASYTEQETPRVTCRVWGIPVKNKILIEVVLPHPPMTFRRLLSIDDKDICTHMMNEIVAHLTTQCDIRFGDVELEDIRQLIRYTLLEKGVAPLGMIDAPYAESDQVIPS